ncbi:unnamed protein product [Peniophora sp. CBMAI 1063]|nr:unnamed protein product [Peniophora sp. CBMAI 1063]
MSSSEDSPLNAEPPKKRYAKKARVYRACDACRRKKVRCKEGPVSGGACAGCRSAGLDCSYVGATQTYPKGYVEALEKKVTAMAALLKELHPDKDFSKRIGGRLTRDNWMQEDVLGEVALSSESPAEPELRVCDKFPKPPTTGSPPRPRTDDPSTVLETYEASDDEATSQRKLQDLSADIVGIHLGSFHGKSSMKNFANIAFRVRSKGEEYDDSLPSVACALMRPWELATYEAHRPAYQFPPPDLMMLLVDTFFMCLNCVTPLLHRQSFQRALADGLHLRDEAFGGVVLLVCANGARLVEDTRVLLPGVSDWSSAGWQWFSQVQLTSRALMSVSRLYDLQAFCLGAIYLQGCSFPHAPWIVVGLGLRLALDIGAHRRKSYGSRPTIESELFKRVFWSLVFMDKWLSAALGRPSAIQEEDFDLDLPLEVDDEYFESPNPALAFKQPPNKPARVAYFAAATKMSRILGYALRTIYTTKKAKTLFGFVGPDWERQIVANFDSVLNRWADSLPDHLRWDPFNPSKDKLLDAAHLMCQYYHLQILVHRPFITSRHASTISFPSLAICTNAARSLARIFTTLLARFPIQAFACLIMPAFMSGVVLLLAIWDAKSSGLALNPVKEIEYVQVCLQILQTAKDRWHYAASLCKILTDLAKSGDVPLLDGFVPPRWKRPREVDGEDSPTWPFPPVSNDTSSLPPSDGGLPEAAAVDPPPSYFDPLPMLTSELGHIPDADPLWGMDGRTFAAEFPHEAFTAPHPASTSQAQWTGLFPSDYGIPDDILSQMGRYGVPAPNTAPNPNPEANSSLDFGKELDAFFAGTEVPAASATMVQGSTPPGSVATAVPGAGPSQGLSEWDWYFPKMYGLPTPSQQQQQTQGSSSTGQWQ